LEHPSGETKYGPLRVDFDRRLRLEFHASRITSDAGPLAYRELDDAFWLTDLAGSVLSECRRGKNTRHLLTGLLRQSVFGRFAGHEDVNDADVSLWTRRCAPWSIAMASTVPPPRPAGWAVSRLYGCSDGNFIVLADLSGASIDRAHARRPQTTVVLDMDNSVSETHGAQEGTAYNGNFAGICYHPRFVFNQFCDLERCALRPGNVHGADSWRQALEPVVARYRHHMKRRFFRADAGCTNPNIYQFFEAEGHKYTILLPANAVLQESAG
jgi:Transposase DDE domain group 1